MGSPHFTPSGKPKNNLTGFSKEMRNQFNAIEAGLEAMNEYAIQLYVPDAKVAATHRVICPFDGIITRVLGVNIWKPNTDSALLIAYGNGAFSPSNTFNWLTSDFADTPKEIVVDEDSASTMTAGQDLYVQGFSATGITPVSMCFVLRRT